MGGTVDFHLLRCSTNLNGPTENFSELDKEILKTVQAAINQCFALPVDMNHVLAQVYANTTLDDKQKKAKISAHAYAM